MSNRLSQSTSPYLLQHAHNPVDWNPWDKVALERARAEDKPIFLSIGYSACHWCHVMERESFEDAAVARELNAHFIPIKVDREERPDLDDLYMGAVQAITGRGGWPMSVWLTPSLKPFFGGTYFPPEARYGSPGFLPLLQRIHTAWRDRRPELEQDAGALAEALARPDPAAADALPGPGPVRQALEQLAQRFDARWGGFGPAPKFPPTAALDLIFPFGSEADRGRAIRTLDAMWEGGMFDHLGGGFARYSVDERWLVPHFEKMLYDNALLAASYLRAWQATGEDRFATIARETLDYLLRDLRDPQGGLHASEDADSEGHEGRFYVFTPPEVEKVLGPVDGPAFCAAYGITEAGNFEHATSVLHRFGAPPGPPPAKELREALRAHRDLRARPAKDDKVLAAWNGLALSALALGHQALGEPRYLAAAEELAGFLRREMWRDGTLLRTWRRGQAHTPGFLEDYGAVACGLIDLFEAGFDPAWLRWAQELGGILVDRFADPAGGFFWSGPRPDLLVRQKPFHDGALPSGNTLAVRALRRLSGHFGEGPGRAAALAALRAATPLLTRMPAACLGLLGELAAIQAGEREIVIAGDPADPRTRALLATAQRHPRAGAALSLAACAPDLPLHQGRLGAEPLAYVCQGGACQRPTADPAELRTLLV